VLLLLLTRADGHSSADGGPAALLDGGGAAVGQWQWSRRAGGRAVLLLTRTMSGPPPPYVWPCGRFANPEFMYCDFLSLAIATRKGSLASSSSSASEARADSTWASNVSRPDALLRRLPALATWLPRAFLMRCGMFAVDALCLAVNPHAGRHAWSASSACVPLRCPITNLPRSAGVVMWSTRWTALSTVDQDAYLQGGRAARVSVSTPLACGALRRGC